MGPLILSISLGQPPLPAGPLTFLQSEGLSYMIAKAPGSSVGLNISPIKDKYQIMYSFFFFEA